METASETRPDLAFIDTLYAKRGVPTLFAGERLCLDFINTLCERRGVPVELLGSGEELRKWLRLAEGVTGKPLCPDDSVWTTDYEARILPRALALRAALHDLVLSVIEKTPTPREALETVNAVLRTNPTVLQIASTEAGFTESVSMRHPEDHWLTVIAQDAADLLCHSDLTLLRQCGCATCVRVFYDTTKNHKRKWCVEKCSSQTKAAAYYQRKKARVQTGD
jgi:predicted RNA-binding Zn ribbon-like protein